GQRGGGGRHAGRGRRELRTSRWLCCDSGCTPALHGRPGKDHRQDSMNRILKSYFYWTYPRGNVHYDVMVSLILIFIFVTPQFWNFGDKPSKASGPAHPITVVGDGDHDVIVSVQASDVHIPVGASN